MFSYIGSTKHIQKDYGHPDLKAFRNVPYSGKCERSTIPKKDDDFKIHEIIPNLYLSGSGVPSGINSITKLTDQFMYSNESQPFYDYSDMFTFRNSLSLIVQTGSSKHYLQNDIFS